METYVLGQKEYPVVGREWYMAGGFYVPLVDIPMMSDEEWEELCRKYPMEGKDRKKE